MRHRLALLPLLIGAGLGGLWLIGKLATVAFRGA